MDRPARGRGGVDEVTDLERAEGDGERGRHVGALELAGVDRDSARDVDGDDRDAVDPGERRRRVGSQPGAAADADDPVDDDVGPGPTVGVGVVRLLDPPAGGPQRGQAALVDPVGQQPRLDRTAAPGEHRAGVQRVAAVVAGPDQQQHPPAVPAAEQVEHRVRQPRGSLLHQRTLRQPGHPVRLGRPHLLDRVRPSHPPTLFAACA